MFSLLAAALFVQTAFAGPLVGRAVPTAEDIARLAPDLGAQSGLNPDQFGSCDGPRQLDGSIPRIPCSCPPNRDTYIQALTANVLAGHATNNPTLPLSFPTGDAVEDKRARITAAVITIQNLNGPGVGCPIASTTLAIQLNNLGTCGDFSCNKVKRQGITRDVVDQLAPDLGSHPNNNPDCKFCGLPTIRLLILIFDAATGTCEGPQQPNGQIPRVVSQAPLAGY
jgi:hypothetical protein